MSTHDGQTPSEEIAELRADVESLGEALAGLARRHAETADRVAAADRDADQSAAALARLEASVAALATVSPPEATAAHSDGPGEDEPAAWVDYAGPEDWASLVDWVDWLMVTYDLDEAWRVLPCWPAHLGVVEELAALRSAWREAALAAAGGAGDALVVWHSTHMAAVLSRVNTRYGTRACHNLRHAPIMRPRLADRTLIDVRSAAGA